MDIKDMVRIGRISSVNAAGNTARVCFPSYGNMVSGSLHILQNQPPEHGNYIPLVGDCVVCLYLGMADGDGFILGRTTYS